MIYLAITLLTQQTDPSFQSRLAISSIASSVSAVSVRYGLPQHFYIQSSSENTKDLGISEVLLGERRGLTIWMRTTETGAPKFLSIKPPEWKHKCSSKQNQIIAKACNEIASMVKYDACRMSWKVTEVGALAYLDRYPATPGGHTSFTVGSEGQLLQIRGGR